MCNNLLTAKRKSLIEVDAKETKTEFDERSTLSIYWIDRCNGYCTLVFSKDNKILSPGDDPRINITRVRKPKQFDRAVLIIKHLTLNDAGNYRCALEMLPTEFADVIVVIKSKCCFLSVNMHSAMPSAALQHCACAKVYSPSP